MKSWLSLCGTELLAYLILPWPLCYEILHCSLICMPMTFDLWLLPSDGDTGRRGFWSTVSSWTASGGTRRTWLELTPSKVSGGVCGDRWMFSEWDLETGLPMMLYLYSPQVKWTQVFPWCSIYILLWSNELKSSHDALFIFSPGQINSSLPMMLYLYSPQVK